MTIARARTPVPFGIALAAVWAIGLVVLLPASVVFAFRPITVGGRFVRWDAAHRRVGGEERSLSGGLRYSLGGGSYGALRDQLTWVGGNVPSTADFEAATRRAFAAWTIVDPATSLPAAFEFVEDLGTQAIDDPGNPNVPGGRTGLNRGAEVDVFAATPHAGAQFGASVVFFVDFSVDDLTLTSGTTGSPGLALAGVDIRINPAFAWSLRGYETLLTHELGHALGLADLESLGPPFLDDDYDPASSATALATLTNAFARLIDAQNPSASPLRTILADISRNPGLDTPGVTLLMETEGYLDLLFTTPKLQNDEFAGRQFLYPVVVPEPDGLAMLVVGGIVIGGLGRRRGRSHGSALRRTRDQAGARPASNAFSSTHARFRE